ncbi:hypothetical protein CJ030_MR7G017749 [Morella rubra]|uniref:Uncharacterized protein n=1 Tax=Morella rubra TaxID=262757 RepID=A0A6A1V778_9ROSI|nr:hypothetical protein CJ030_MR7G017749 [Morella rubra]
MAPRRSLGGATQILGVMYRGKKSDEPLIDEKEIGLRKELNASLAARKSLEMLYSSLGKEKEIMASELSRKVQELSGMEELINDLKAQNEMLRAKVQTCAEEHKEKKCGKGETARECRPPRAKQGTSRATGQVA